MFSILQLFLSLSSLLFALWLLPPPHPSSFLDTLFTTLIRHTPSAARSPHPTPHSSFIRIFSQSFRSRSPSRFTPSSHAGFTVNFRAAKVSPTLAGELFGGRERKKHCRSGKVFAKETTNLPTNATEVRKSLPSEISGETIIIIMRMRMLEEQARKQCRQKKLLTKPFHCGDGERDIKRE